LWQVLAEPHDDVMKIEAGTYLLVTTASGEKVRMRAMGHPVRGRDFPVVWVCTDEEYDQLVQGGVEPQGIPWPVEAVEVASPANA